MFPALSDFHDSVKAASGKRGKEWLFAINKLGRKLDRMGIRHGKYFTNIKFSNILRFCRFDIFHNDVFTMGGSVFRQIRGLAIGGPGSTQLANITLFQAEVKGYP